MGWTLTMASNDELACVYAALILMDDDVSITVEKINAILKAADVSVEPYWPGLFAKAASGLDLKSIVSNIGAGVGSGGGGVELPLLLEVMLLPLRKKRNLNQKRKNLMRTWASACSARKLTYCNQVEK